MSNQIVVNDNFQVPSLQIDASVLQKIQGSFNTAAANTASKAFPRLSFKGREFNLTENGITTSYPEKTLDVYVAAVNERFHYQFYEGEYTGKESDKEYASMSRYPNEHDPIQFTPTAEWKTRLYRQRAVLVIDGDPDMRLIATDLGYMSVKKKNTQGGNYMNLSDLLAHFSEFGKRFPNFLPFMIKVQLSFTKDSVPAVQFSLVDENNPAAGIRQGNPKVVNKIAQAHADGTIAKMLEIEYDSRSFENSEPAVPQAEYTGQQSQAPMFQQGVEQSMHQGINQVQQQQFQQPAQQQYQQPVQTPQQQQYMNQVQQPFQQAAQQMFAQQPAQQQHNLQNQFANQQVQQPQQSQQQPQFQQPHQDMEEL